HLCEHVTGQQVCRFDVLPHCGPELALADECVTQLQVRITTHRIGLHGGAILGNRFNQKRLRHVVVALGEMLVRIRLRAPGQDYSRRERGGEPGGVLSVHVVSPARRTRASASGDPLATGTTSRTSAASVRLYLAASSTR